MSAHSMNHRKPVDFVSQRGKRFATPLSTAVFVGLRLFMPAVQYGMFAYGWGHAILASMGLSAAVPYIANHLTPRQWLLVGFSAIVSTRQIFWASYINRNPILLSEAIPLSIIPFIIETINSLLSLRVAGSDLGLVQIVASGLFALGCYWETYSELQRKWFLDAHRHNSAPGDGKRGDGSEPVIYTRGLFAYARHINYGGYVLWRSATGVATGNWAGIWAFLFAFSDFRVRGVPALDAYMAAKYPIQWKAYRANVPYKLWPGIY